MRHRRRATRPRQVEAQCVAQKFYVDVDDSGDTLNKKIRNAQLAQYNFIFGACWALFRSLSRPTLRSVTSKD